MTAVSGQERSTLKWLRAELADTIQQATRSLEDFIEGAQSPEQMNVCASHLHQVRGTLLMVELYGAAMLAEEMEQVALALAANATGRRQEAGEALMVALVQMPEYLDRLEHGAPDMPLAVLPMLNDLRAAREAPLLSESSLFAPHLDQLLAAEAVSPGSGNPELNDLAKRLRGRFHRGLLSWYRNVGAQEGLGQLAEVCQHLHDSAGTARMKRLFRAAQGLALALGEQSLDTSLAVKQLLGRVDREIKRVIDKGEEEAAGQLPVAVLRNLLYYVAHADSEAPVVRGLKDDYQLDSAIALATADPEELTRPGSELMGAVRQALNEDLAGVKEALDEYISGDREDSSPLQPLVGVLQRTADTLGMLGQGALQVRLKKQAEHMQALMDGEAAPSDDGLMEMAGDLLFVESSLNNLGAGTQPLPEELSGDVLPQGEFRAHVTAALGQAEVELARVKEVVTAYLGGQAERDALQGSPERLREVAGVFKVLSQSNAAALLEGTGIYIEKELMDRAELPDAASMDALAEVVTSVEYYMEALQENRADRDDILQYARDALNRLMPGWLAEALPGSMAESADEPEQVAEAAVPEAEAQAEPMDVEAGGEADVEPEPAPPSAAPYQTQPKPPMDDVDTEILEIFVEEAREELEVIQDNYPAWRDNPQNETALSTFRRAFHTLKGSGRLVGAMSIGELAWSVENLLNRIIDGTREPSDEFYRLLDRVLEVLPGLIDAQESGEAPAVDVASLQEVGFALAEGRAPDMAALSAAPAPAAEPPAEPVPEEAPGEEAAVETEPEAEPEMALEPMAETPMEELPEAFEEETAAEPVLAEGPETETQPESPASELELEPLPESGPEPAIEPGFEAEPESEPEPEPDQPAEEPLSAAEPEISTDLSLEEIPEPESEQASFVAEAPSDESPLEVSGTEPGEFQAEAESVAGTPPEEEPLPGAVEPSPEMPESVVEIAEPVQAGAEQEATPEETPADTLPPLAEQGLESESVLQDDGSQSSLEMDSQLLDIFRGETQGHLETVQEYLGNCETTGGACAVSEGLCRALHTLHGSARMADMDPIAEVAGALEKYFQTLQRHQLPTSDDDRQLLLGGLNHIRAVMATINVPGTELPDGSALVDDAHGRWERLEEQLASQSRHAEPAPAPQAETSAPGVVASELDEELVEIFLEEARELLEVMEQSMQQWHQNGADRQPISELQRTLHTLKGGARLAGVTPLGDLSHAFETYLITLEQDRIEVTPQRLDLAQRATDRIANQIDELGAGDLVQAAPDLVARLSAKPSDMDEGSWPPSMEISDAFAPPEASPGSESVSVEVTAEPSSIAPEPMAPPEPPLEEPAAGETELAAPLEEDSSFLQTDSPSSASVVVTSGMLADTREHDSETVTGAKFLTDTELLRDSQLTEEDSREISIEVPSVELTGEEAGVMHFDRQQAAKKSAQPKEAREQIRVSSDLLDKLVNHAGEVSIYRARLEQQNTNLGFNLGELEQTLERLRHQLRQMEIETEAQILFRFEREHENDAEEGHQADFDPLELDRFSNIQQLSRSLAETVNDLASVKDVMGELTRDTETLLLQQSRVTNDLQDGLLRTRMVPFSARISRLRRLVRQTADAVGKQARFDVEGASGEMDRRILDRMMGPLEHLLRNSVSHGVETPEERRATGKPEEGVVSLYLAREGTEVVLTVSDDGRGLNLQAIREKAESKGLLEPGAEIPDDDLMQFVLEPGFSTADAVTQIAGRGVGMDVVASEVKQLGGTLEIDSQPGRGTSFVIRLPYTLAIMDALLVQVGDDIYAIPHSTMEGIVRIGREDLMSIYADEREDFEYIGHHYQVRYMGAILSELKPNMAEMRKWYPMLLVRAGEHRLALQVDQLIGNRQIVVKSVGAQISTVRWVTGGTILGDGQVALIIDVGALVRMDIAHRTGLAPTMAPEEEEPVAGMTVMVVDDSITVRKVTSRLLARHNMQVVTAKDGVDAVALLADHHPDVMLLDIEMPRMDGFELARHMRNSNELKDIPIIMITSRTGDKHRERAMSLGVKRYLGKPYQETELLENIYTVLAEK